jgi:putative membrane protein
MDASQARSRRRIRDGVLVGLLASGVKALSEPRLQGVVEHFLPPSPEQKLDVGADPAGHPENMPPAVIIGRVALALANHRLTAAQRVRGQLVVHYSFGAGLGVAYKLAADRWTTVARARGAMAGLAIYGGTHGSVLPALGIQRPPWRLAPAAVVWEAATHVLFGMALEGTRRALGERR